MKKYRIKRIVHVWQDYPSYMVQVRSWLGLWIDVKYFYDWEYPQSALWEAEELLDKLNEQ